VGWGAGAKTPSALFTPWSFAAGRRGCSLFLPPLHQALRPIRVLEIDLQIEMGLEIFFVKIDP